MNKNVSESSVDLLMKSADQWMDQLGFSPKRKLVALQNGGLRRMFERVCDESLSDQKRAEAYLAVEAGIIGLAGLPESVIDEVNFTILRDFGMQKPKTCD